jgi:LacI family transcriptional regulator
MELQTPIVTLDRRGGDYDLITSNVKMGADLIAHEVSRCGFRTIGLVHGPQNLPAAKLRATEFRKALEARCTIKWETKNSFSIEIGKGNAEILRQYPVDAIICANDMIAIGVMRHLKDARLAVPDDVSIIGFDDIPWSSLVDPQLTTVRQDQSQIGSRAVDLLLPRIADPGGVRRTIEVDVEWRARRSTAKKAAKSPALARN